MRDEISKGKFTTITHNQLSLELVPSSLKSKTCRKAKAILLKNEITILKNEVTLLENEVTSIDYEVSNMENEIRYLRGLIEKITLREQQQKLKIQRSPGSLMIRFAEIILSKKRYERDCQAALADWHEEYFEALDQKRGKAKMAAIRIRHTWGFLKATGCLVVLEMLGKLVAKLISKISGA